jgi:hypothetical protein
VRDFEFDPEDGRVAGLVFDAFGLPLVPVRNSNHPCVAASALLRRCACACVI